jgi:hypothetical protein
MGLGTLLPVGFELSADAPATRLNHARTNKEHLLAKLRVHPILVAFEGVRRTAQ